MSESIVDKKHFTDYQYDILVDTEHAIQAHKQRIEYERREWHKLHDPPEPGIGIDGYPLQKPLTK